MLALFCPFFHCIPRLLQIKAPRLSSAWLPNSPNTKTGKHTINCSNNKQTAPLALALPSSSPPHVFCVLLWWWHFLLQQLSCLGATKVLRMFWQTLASCRWNAPSPSHDNVLGITFLAQVGNLPQPINQPTPMTRHTHTHITHHTFAHTQTYNIPAHRTKKERKGRLTLED